MNTLLLLRFALGVAVVISKPSQSEKGPSLLGNNSSGDVADEKAINQTLKSTIRKRREVSPPGVEEGLRKIALYATGKIPYVGSEVSLVVNLFWHDSKINVEAIFNKVEKMIDDSSTRAISGLLRNDIEQMKARITQVQSEMAHERKAHSHYMNVAQDLIGFEKRFIFDDTYIRDPDELNYQTLSLYSNVVLMKLSFYTAGIKEREKIGLDEYHVDRLKEYSRKIIKGDNENVGAEKYIQTLFSKYSKRTSEKNPFIGPRKECAFLFFGCEYKHTSDTFNTIVHVDNYFSQHGFEFIPVWNTLLNIQENPMSYEREYNGIITYSDYFGRNTNDLSKAASSGEFRNEPLTPALINGRRNKLASVRVYIWQIDQALRIGGLTLTFENGKNYTMGTITKSSELFELGGAHIREIVVCGFWAVDTLEIRLSDGRSRSFGEKNPFLVSKDYYYRVISKDGHHIASMILDHDYTWLAGQAANIAVSFVANED